jgi:hypothetical protein
MRGEAEIRQKIEGYEAMLAGIEVGKSIDTPVFLAVSQYFPREAMEMVSTSSAADELTQGMVRQLVLCQFSPAGAGIQNKYPQVGAGGRSGVPWVTPPRRMG